MRVFLRFVVSFALLAPPAMADVAVKHIADDSLLRAEVRETHLLAQPSAALERPSVIKTLPGGDAVRIRVEKGSEAFSVVFERRRANVFSAWLQGSFSYTRDTRTGEPRFIRIFLRSDPYTYIQLRPDTRDKNRTLLDAVAYDAYLQRGAPIPISFDRALTAPLNDIIAAAGVHLPMKYYEPNTAHYPNIKRFITEVRARLPALDFADDGAIDAAGDYVFIATGSKQTGKTGLNCSGFAKWLVDLLISNGKGKNLEIDDLKAPFGERGSGITRPWESLRDPFFGLDWTRNLASFAFSASFPLETANLADLEVQNAPFSEITERKNGVSRVVPYAPYIKDAGFEAAGIAPLLYTLAIDEPDTFFLAAISDDRGAVRPRLRQFFHVAALLPYFDGQGVFHVVVFESAAETQFSRFSTRYPGNFINLVRVTL